MEMRRLWKKMSARFAMQDLDAQRKNIEARVAKDPTKAATVDRLGIGGVGRARAAHSVATGVRTIKQSDLSGRGSAVEQQPTKDEDDWEVVEDSHKFTSSHKDDDLFTTDYKSKAKKENDEFFDAFESQPQKSRFTAGKAPVAKTAPDVDAQKKFANAKAISSDMFFGSNEMDYETKSALSRFEGQSSLGSEDLWGNGSQVQPSQVPDLGDMKDSLRAGASKVAEKFSNLSSSFASYMSDRY
ncbi:unnamed protein product [Caenorhabditis auriculariae]|uniref:Uncharacterized protein n=1 Tax=Caenorhabditis auriculariae TaxID=2777116 RepID=A0A8S1HGJ7_9PELO|nr:unnamed protein product [Caenorhabditis auriculariae]